MLAALDGAQGGAQAGEAHDGGHHHVDTAHLHHLHHGLLAGEDLDVVRVQCIVYLLIFALVGDDDGVGGEFQGLFDEQVGIGAGTEHLDPEEVAVAADDVERLCADGAGGT